MAKATSVKIVSTKPAARAQSKTANQHKFEAVRLETLFPVLDAIAWIGHPTTSQVAQFAGIDPRTAGKLVKNAVQINLIENGEEGHSLNLPYPYKGSHEQKATVVREAMVKLPLLTSVRQFLKLGDDIDVALRKAATIAAIVPFVASDLKPLLNWATQLDALDINLLPEDLITEAEDKKDARHHENKNSRIVFISHSSVDKPFVRQLAGDLAAEGIGVWLDEQKIRVGESIPEKIAQGLAESDYFLIAISKKSMSSEWVRKELNNAMISEVKRRKVHVLPLKIDDTDMPDIISDKKYADFSISYKSGLDELLTAVKDDVDG